MKLSVIVILILVVFHSCNKHQDEKEIIVTNSLAEPIKDSLSTPHSAPQIVLPFDVTGTYDFEDAVAGCKMHLKLFHENGLLKYRMQTNTRTFTGDAHISNEKELYLITFKNIPWSENLGRVEADGNTPSEKLPLPTDIVASLRDQEIIFKNYGNAYAYYVVLQECDVNYVVFSKSTEAIPLGEDIPRIDAYAKDIYQKNGKIYIDLDLVEIRYPTEGVWDVADRKIINNNPKIRTYEIDDATSILTSTCKEVKAPELLQLRTSILKDHTIIVIGQAKQGKLLEINFGCYG